MPAVTPIPAPGVPPTRGPSRPAIRAWCARSLLLNGAVCVAIVLVCLLLWGMTAPGNFWPGWVLFGLTMVLAFQLGLARVLAVEDGRARWFLLDALVLAAVAILCVALWAGLGMGTFWPIWVLLGALVWLTCHAVVAFRDRLLESDEHRGLQRRVEQLTRTRAGALDAQATELNRIERDLHDGAQARLVSMTMSLGLAREHIGDDPDRARALVDEAREQAKLAIGELRDLARGIAPPILLDRGLEAAVRALVGRGAVPVTVTADGLGRAPEPVERAAYFVVAEAVANAAKHGTPTAIGVTLRGVDGELLVRVDDDGAGGADPAGSGLAGLRARTDALDGELTVTSPPGGPTIVEARFPCGS